MYDTHHASLAQAAVSLVGKLPPSSKDGGPSSLLRLLRAVDALERNVAQTTETTRDFAALRSFFCAAANERKLAHLDWAAKVDAAVLTAIRANCDLFNINWNAVVTFTGAPEENKENSLDPLLDSEFDAIQLAMNSRLDLIDSLSNVNHFNTSKGILTGSGVSFLNLNNTLKPNTTSNINLNSTLNISPIKPTHPKNLIPPVSVLAKNEDIEVENENMNETDSEDDIDLLQKAFTAWNLITRRSRHERNCMIHYWLLAVQVWKRNSLTHCFQKWISKDHIKKLARKRKAFQALYEHATIPNEHAFSFNRNRILSGALSKWFRNAYRKRSMKRKEEVAEDTAILVHDLNIQCRYLKKWRRKFAKQFLLKDGTDLMNELCSMNLKRRFWRLWKQRLRNVIKANKFHEKQLVEAFFVKWMHRKHLKKLDQKALNHRKYLDNDLKSVYFHVWREKRKLKKAHDFQLLRKYWSSWIQWTQEKQILAVVADSLETENNLSHVQNYFDIWKESFIRDYSLRLRLQLLATKSVKKWFLQWIRHTRYKQIVDPYHAKISMKSFQISRMLFYDTGRQVDGMEALDGVCEIARDVIKSAVVDRLTHFFGMWKYRYDGVRRRWGMAVKHHTASVWKSMFSFWKARFDVYSGLTSMAKTRREQRLFRAYWDKWIARKREKIELDFYIRHEAFVSKQIFSCKKNAFQIWRLVRLRNKRLNTIFDEVSSTTSQNLIRKCLSRWISRVNLNSSRVEYIEVESNMRLKFSTFKTWHQRCFAIWDSMYASDLIFQRKYFGKWQAACVRNKSLNKLFEEFRNLVRRRRVAAMIRFWRVKRRLRLFEMGTQIVQIHHTRRVQSKVLCYWRDLYRTKKADRFRATQVTQVHWTRWRNNVIENSEQVLSALLYQKWITILSFHRWVVVFQKRINASVFTTGEVELAPADPYSLRRVPYDKYPSYYVPHSANQSEPKSLIKLLLSVRVSGWAGATATDYPKSAQAALELNRSTPPNIRLSFGTLFERKRQDQAMRQSFKSWKQHTENVARNERLADEFRDEMLQNTCFRQWRKQWKHRATLAQLELEFVNRRVIKTVGLLLRKWWYKWMALNMQDRIVSENFRVNLVKAVFGDWLYLHKLNQAALQVSEINNFVYVTELFLFWKRRAVESRRDRILKMKAVDMSEIRTTRSVFLHWRNKATNYRLERLLTLRAVEYWKAKTCRAVIHGIRSCILTRQTEVTLAAILFLRLRRGIYFQKWRECLSLKRRCDQMATLSNAFRTLILERKAMNTWRAATLRNFKFAVINLKLAQKERRQLQAMCILKWRHRADQSIKASKMIKTRELQLRDAMFLNWKNKTGLRRQSGIFFREHQKNPLLLRFFKTWKERTRRVLMQRIAVESYEFNRLQMFVMMWKQKLKQRRKTISVQQAFTKLEEFCSINLLRVAFQAFKDNRKRSLALEEVYSSSLRLKLARSIGVPRTSRSSVPQIQSLLLEKVYFTTWLERYLSQTLADQLRKTQLLTKHLRKWRAALIPINEQRVTSDQFNSNRIKTRVWETWTDRLGAVQILRERSQMKRQILMRWYHWARTERSIREFVLKHKFTHWRKVLKKKEKLHSLVKKADRFRKFSLSQRMFYQWWRRATLRIASISPIEIEPTNISEQVNKTPSRQDSSEWLAAITASNNRSKRESARSTIHPSSSQESFSEIRTAQLTAEEFMYLEELADDFRLKKLCTLSWKRWKRASNKKLFERERKVVFAATWAKKALKRKVLMGWMSQALSK